MPSDSAGRDAARVTIAVLVERYTRNRDRYRVSTYNEETCRAEFITPLFEALGWDVTNKAGYAEQYKDVIHEEGIKVGDFTKAPDYTFRVAGVRKFFVEAKKPFVDLKSDPAPAYQLRRYAWSAKLPLSVLTDFEEVAVYDTRIRPKEGEKPSVGRILYLTYDELLPKLDELWDIFSKDAVLKGSFDRYAEATRGKRGTSEVDAEFLREIEGWRDELARNIAIRNEDLSVDDLNFAVQTTIDRIIFLRIAEGRGAEPYANLLALVNGPDIYKRLVALYRKADVRYNSGLFDFKSDRLTTGIAIDDKVLKPILLNLYYPQSPYEFSVLPAEILGNVYEQFLGKVIRLTPGHRAVVEEKPEVKKAGGVYYTPTYIVDYIVKQTVGTLCGGRSPKQMEKLRILDPACGSGSFLLRAYQELLDRHLAWYRDRQPEKHPEEVFVGPGGDWRLTTAEKRRIVLNNIYGVDIDRQAVEVTKLSLLLKVLEGENDETLKQHSLFGERALPSLEGNIKCGNSLIGTDAFTAGLFPDPEEMRQVNPFDWKREFPKILDGGGFDVVIGNPPYLNIDDTWGTKDIRLGLIKTSFPEIYNDKTDLLFYFLAKGGQLCKSRLSFIVSRAFLEAYKADRLRSWLLSHCKVERVIDFQNFYVFPGVGITTAIVALQPGSAPTDVTSSKLRGSLPQPYDLASALDSPSLFRTVRVAQTQLSVGPWSFSSASVRAVEEKIDAAGERVDRVLRLGKGMETGRNDVFGERNEEEIRAWAVPGTLWYKRATNSDIQRYLLRDRGECLLYLEDVADFVALPKGVQKHLRDNAKALQERAAFKRGNCEWWKYTWPLHKDWYDRKRILCPYLAQTNRFALESKNEFLGLTDTTVLFDNGQAESLLYILGLLNSRLLTFRFRSIGKLKSGGIYEYFWNSVSKLPIRRIDFSDKKQVAIHDEIVGLVERAQRAAAAREKARSTHDVAEREREITLVDARIETLVRGLYGITDDEAAVIESEMEAVGAATQDPSGVHKNHGDPDVG